MESLRSTYKRVSMEPGQELKIPQTPGPRCWGSEESWRPPSARACPGGTAFCTSRVRPGLSWAPTRQPLGAFPPRLCARTWPFCSRVFRCNFWCNQRAHFRLSSFCPLCKLSLRKDRGRTTTSYFKSVITRSRSIPSTLCIMICMDVCS